MSRRYGRNQKRRAREEVAQLESMVRAQRDANLRDVGMFQGVLAEKRAALAAVANALGPAFVGLPLNELMLRILDVADAERAPDSFTVVPPDGDGPVTMQLLKMRTTGDLLRDMVHVRVRLAGAEAGYALSNASIKRLPARVLARNIAEQLAEHLVRALEQQGARR